MTKILLGLSNCARKIFYLYFWEQLHLWNAIWITQIFLVFSFFFQQNNFFTLKTVWGRDWKSRSISFHLKCFSLNNIPPFFLPMGGKTKIFSINKTSVCKHLILAVCWKKHSEDNKIRHDYFFFILRMLNNPHSSIIHIFLLPSV